MNDQKIIELIGSGKSDRALEVLYRHFPMMRKLILLRGGTAQDAEDIFQEALIILCRKAGQPDFILTSQLSTYLFSVCRFLWNDELKRRKHILPGDFETGLEQAQEEELQVAVEEEHRAKLAEKILNELGERCRELLVLFYNKGLKLQDIASRMGYSSENTAKNQKYKCLEGARNRLKELKQATQTF